MSAHYRRRSREEVPGEPLEDLPETRAALESLASILEGTPEEDLHRKEIAHLVHVTLDFLPDGYGDALEWKYARGLSVKEIADRLNVSPKAAESLLTRAREAFRREFTSLTEGRYRERALKT
jgi:RNA polymerase sigma factor (sigma-70 family)